ncbi:MULTISPECIES: hypothetical protein [Paraliobacillus]|uniref:hypothetical protein n=1 Tax=Paraliobacillus TaxID=200903 RepID=UPI000DD4CC7B|nr:MULTISPECIES: hypothetical protein [Paraliobacillus]
MKKRVTYLLIFIVGLFLFTFSINMPSLGYKNIVYVEETSDYQVTDYSWYGKPTNSGIFIGNSEEMLEILQKQIKIQNLQASIILFTLISIVSWFIREKQFFIYSNIFITIVIILVDIAIVNDLIQ